MRSFVRSFPQVCRDTALGHLDRDGRLSDGLPLLLAPPSITGAAASLPRKNMRRALLQRTSQRQSRDQQQSFPPGRTDLLQHLALVLELQLNNLAELEAQQQPVDHGITDESFDAIPTVRAGDIGLGDQQCTICMGDFEEDDTLKVLPCSELHAFHSECIQRWLNKQSSCPLCRNECGERRVPPPPEHLPQQQTIGGGCPDLARRLQHRSARGT